LLSTVELNRLSARRVVSLACAEAALSLALGLFKIGDKSLWFDEGFSAMVASGDLRSIYDVARRDQNMFGYYVLLHIWRLFGENEASLRALSAIAMAGAVLVIVAVGRRLYGASVGLLAGLILAVAPFAVHYAQELRSYGLLVLFVSLSSYLFVRGIERPGWIPWAAYALCASFSVYLQLFGALVILAHATSLLFLDRSNRPGRYLSVTAAVIGVLLLPLALIIVFGPDTVPYFIQTPTLHSVAVVVGNVGGGRVLAVVLSVLCGISAWVAFRCWRRDGASMQTWRLAFAVLWLLVPFGVTLAFSLLVQPFFLDRYLIITLPAVALVAAFGVAQLRSAWLVPAMLAVLVLSAIGIVNWYRAGSHDDWRGAVAYVMQDARSDDGIVFCEPWTRPAFEYYVLRSDSKSRPIPLSPAKRWSARLNTGPPRPAGQWPPHVARIWVIRAYEGPVSVAPGCNLTSSMDGRSLSRDRGFQGVRVQRYDTTT
jgi:mannosyltransferase